MLGEETFAVFVRIQFNSHNIFKNIQFAKETYWSVKSTKELSQMLNCYTYLLLQTLQNQLRFFGSFFSPVHFKWHHNKQRSQRTLSSCLASLTLWLQEQAQEVFDFSLIAFKTFFHPPLSKDLSTRWMSTHWSNKLSGKLLNGLTWFSDKRDTPSKASDIFQFWCIYSF